MAKALYVQPKEQTIVLDEWTANLRFNIFDKYWYYDLYLGTQLVLAGVKLTVNAYPLAFETLPYPKLFLVDSDPTNTNPPDVLSDLGGRLELIETDYVEE
jgi:hypothetical protein